MQIEKVADEPVSRIRWAPFPYFTLFQQLTHSKGLIAASQ